MTLLNLKNVSFTYINENIVENVDLSIKEGEKIALLGRNGSGKTTLMKIINGDIKNYKGKMFRKAELKTTFLLQQVPKNIEGTTAEVVTSGLGHVGKLITDFLKITSRISAEPDNDALMNKLHRMEKNIEANAAWELERNVDEVITHLSLNPNSDFTNLSAGNKRKVLLAKCLVTEPDILLLDEPTNHLDIKSITWLEDFIRDYKGSVVFVTHDRAFLKKLSQRIIDIDLGRVKTWDCTYEEFIENKQQLIDSEKKEKELFEKKLSREEKWIREGVRERRKRDQGRVRALLEMREKKRKQKQRVGNAKMQIQQSDLSGKRVIRAKNISFSYSHQTIVNDFSIDILRGEKIGIIGDNGCGKTTLIKLLLKQIEPDAGNVEHGTNLQVAYFDQLHAQLELGKSVYENVTHGTYTVVIDGKSRNVFGYLQDFLFTPDRAKTSVKNLSGGERNRLLLARLFSQPCNLLILDEPTNDLDLETMQLLEEQLLNFNGTILMVSHDRQFLDNVVTSCFAFEAPGVVNEYTGGYRDYIDHKKQQQVYEPTPEEKKKPKTKKKEKTKLSYHEQRELKSLPDKIENLEEHLNKLHDKMSDPDFYKEQNSKISETKNRLETIEAQLSELYQRWEYLEQFS